MLPLGATIAALKNITFLVQSNLSSFINFKATNTILREQVHSNLLCVYYSFLARII